MNGNGQEDKLAPNGRKKGIGLALAGGGYRAALFHLGSLWRLNELGVLPQVREVTGVSGGSIVTAWLGLKWKALRFDDKGTAVNFPEIIIDPVRGFCSRTIDLPSILGGILLPLVFPGQILSHFYHKYLFGDATLQDFPEGGDGPIITLYATNMQTGVSFRMTRQHLADYRLGEIRTPRLPLADAVAASSAFPPFLCPFLLTGLSGSWCPTGGKNLPSGETGGPDTVYLGDGGIYDNMGLERVWERYETVLVSDAGAPFSLMPCPSLLRFSQLARAKRTLDIIGEQARALRKRRLMDFYRRDAVKGTYWGIASETASYGLAKYGRRAEMVRDNEVTRSLGRIRTRLNRFSPLEQGYLINWGYAITDTAMRRWVLDHDPGPGRWPAPEHIPAP